MFTVYKTAPVLIHLFISYIGHIKVLLIYCYRTFYWSNMGWFNNKVTIDRLQHKVDGSASVETIVSTDLSCPRAIALDIQGIT